MNEPTIVNIHKVKGVRPAFDLYIGRAVQYTEFTEDSKWHNPFHVKKFGDKTLPLYEYYMCSLLMYTIHRSLMQYTKNDFIAGVVKQALGRWRKWDIDELTGKTMGCWCKPAACHGDVLIKLWKEKHHAENRD